MNARIDMDAEPIGYEAADFLSFPLALTVKRLNAGEALGDIKFPFPTGNGHTGESRTPCGSAHSSTAPALSDNREAGRATESQNEVPAAQQLQVAHPFTFSAGDRIEWPRGCCETVLDVCNVITTEYWCAGGRGNVYRYADDEELLQEVRDSDGIVYRRGERVYPPEEPEGEITREEIIEHQRAMDRELRERGAEFGDE